MLQMDAPRRAARVKKSVLQGVAAVLWVMISVTSGIMVRPNRSHGGRQSFPRIAMECWPAKLDRLGCLCSA
jgi:hypothetical protein